ncbi:hypothetical protein [Pseudoclavibacter terrae]|uniref:Lactococcin 972 family bacteriocin n=1 Tax=Pseudoclavibacter terrae TaxID=1530195 RepID=A0A7J5B3V1_9MICO|nr:hypothetical protein [Pseudoclavibacter terrae]KAB1638838.1 hypothetical protein F8O03_00290 [Pseudoclavibacter terrae]
MSTTTLKNKVSRKLGTLLLAGALATGGVAVAQVAAAPEAEAGVCGSTAQWNGYARTYNPCGYGYAKVSRIVNGSPRAQHDYRYYGWASVSYTAGYRNYELTYRS